MFIAQHHLDKITLRQIDRCSTAYAERLSALLPRKQPSSAALGELKDQAWKVALLDLPNLQKYMDSFHEAASNGGVVPTEEWTRDAQIGRYITQKAGGKTSHLYVRTYENGEDSEVTMPDTAKQPSRLKRMIAWVEDGNDIIPDAATLAYWGGGSEASWRSTLSTLKRHGYEHERAAFRPVDLTAYGEGIPVKRFTFNYVITKHPVSKKQQELEARLEELQAELVAVRTEYLQEIDPQ